MPVLLFHRSISKTTEPTPDVASALPPQPQPHFSLKNVGKVVLSFHDEDEALVDRFIHAAAEYEVHPKAPASVAARELIQNSLHDMIEKFCEGTKLLKDAPASLPAPLLAIKEEPKDDSKEHIKVDSSYVKTGSRSRFYSNGW